MRSLEAIGTEGDMRSSRILIVLAALTITATACGDDAGGTDTAAPTTTAAATIPPVTTAPTTTTSTTTTTLPPDAHPVFGLSWADVWPPDGSTAVYRITMWDGSERDVPARFDVGADFRGETFDRITFGTSGGGSPAMEVYLDRSDPWVLAIKAVVTYTEQVADGPVVVEMFEEPVVFDGSLPIGESAPVETEVILEFGGEPDAHPATYSFAIVSVGDAVDVPLGRVTGTAYANGTVSGEEFLGGPEPFTAEMWLHPEHLIVRMTGSPAFDVIEIVETWTR